MVDHWKEEKKGLKAKDPDAFVHAAAHLLLQRKPELTAEVKKVEPRLWKIALEASPKPKKRIEAIKCLVKLQSPDLPKLEALLTERSTELVDTAATALGGKLKAPKAVEALIAKFERPGDWSPQYDAIRALRHFDDPRVVATLLKALEHPQGAVKREALAGLGHLGAKEGLPHFLAALGSSNPQHVTAGARALSTMDDPKAREALANPANYKKALALAKNPIEGRFAVHALTWFTTPTVDDDLVALLKKDDGEVQAGAISALAKRNAQGALADVATWALGKSDSGYYGRFVLEFVSELAEKFGPEPKAAAALVAVLEKVKPERLAAVAEESEQLRYRYDRFEGEALERLKAWRKAFAAAKKNKKEIVALLEEP